MRGVSLTSADAPSSTVSLCRRTSTDSSRPRKPPLLLSLTVRRRRSTGRRPMLLILAILLRVRCRDAGGCCRWCRGRPACRGLRDDDGGGRDGGAFAAGLQITQYG